jgi:hypothetical protein
MPAESSNRGMMASKAKYDTNFTRAGCWRFPMAIIMNFEEQRP